VFILFFGFIILFFLKVGINDELTNKTKARKRTTGETSEICTKEREGERIKKGRRRTSQVSSSFSLQRSTLAINCHCPVKVNTHVEFSPRDGRFFDVVVFRKHWVVEKIRSFRAMAEDEGHQCEHR
jgi:hypothetical protein